MRLNLLIDLITASGVCDDNFGAREIGTLYNLAMMTQVDEIHKTRHMDMRFIEFVELLARVADKAITRKTQEFVGRDPNAAGAAGALEGGTPPPSNMASSIKKQTQRSGNVSGNATPKDRSKSAPREGEASKVTSKKTSKPPSRAKARRSQERVADASNEDLVNIAKFESKGATDDSPLQLKSQMSFRDPQKADDALIQLKPMDGRGLGSPQPGLEHKYQSSP